MIAFRKDKNMQLKAPKYRKHLASGRAVVTLNGRDCYLGPYGSEESKKSYRRLVAEYFASDGLYLRKSETKALSISDLAAAYLLHVKKEFGGDRLSRRELMDTGYGDAILGVRALTTLYGSTLASEFGPHSLKAIRADLLIQHKSGKRKDGKPNRQLSRPVVNRRIRAVIRIFKWGVSESLITAELWHSLKAVEGLKFGKSKAPEPDPVKPVDTSIVEATLLPLPPIVCDMIRFQLLVGCRPGEVCSLTPEMIDRTGEVWEAHLDKHKSAWRGKKRVVFIGPMAQAIITKYLYRPAGTHCFSPREAMDQRLAKRAQERETPANQGNRPGYTGQTRMAKEARKRHTPFKKVGDRYTTASYGQAIGYGCRLAFPAPRELKGKQLTAWHSEHRWSPNQLRHNAATRIRKSHGLEAASVILGHAELGVTQVYAEADRDKAIAISKSDG